MAFLIRDKIVNNVLENISTELNSKRPSASKHKKIDAIRYLIKQYQEHR
jgi:hypothetical protein